MTEQFTQPGAEPVGQGATLEGILEYQTGWAQGFYDELKLLQKQVGELTAIVQAQHSTLLRGITETYKLVRASQGGAVAPARAKAAPAPEAPPQRPQNNFRPAAAQAQRRPGGPPQSAGRGSSQGQGAAPPATRTRYPGQRPQGSPPADQIDPSEFPLIHRDMFPSAKLDELLGFGKHANRSYEYMVDNHKDYLEWLVRQAIDASGSMDPALWTQKPSGRIALWALQHCPPPEQDAQREMKPAANGGYIDSEPAPAAYDDDVPF